MSQIKIFDSQGLYMLHCDCGRDHLIKIDHVKKCTELIGSTFLSKEEKQ